MQQAGRNIYAFACIRYADPDHTAVADVRRCIPELCATSVESTSRAEDILAFPSASQCLGTVEAVLRTGARSGALAAVGVSVGEASPECLDGAHAVHRARELSWLAQDGQVLISGSAHDVVRPILPPGMHLKAMGEVRMDDSLCTEPISQLCMPGLPSEFGPLPGSDLVHSNINELPPGFVGRDQLARLIPRLLANDRLVTLTGPGGVGKSALARLVAYDLADAFQSGSWWIDLSKIPEDGNVAHAMIADLRLPAAQGRSSLDHLLFHLGQASAVIVMDGCDHLRLGVASVVSALTEGCPDLRFIATGTRHVGLGGERIVVVPPLAVPDERDSPGEAERKEAIRLFYDRAAKAGCQLSETDLEQVIAACRAVDGLPLGIELTAAKLATLGLGELVRTLLEHSGDVAAEDEDEDEAASLDRTISWSFGMLSRAERVMLSRLSVIEGEWPRGVGIAVGSGAWVPADSADKVLSALIERSFVKHETGDRLRLLRPIQEFAKTMLPVYEMPEKARKRYTSHVRAEVKRAKGAAGTSELLWHSFVKKNYSHVRATVRWLLRSDPDEAAAFCGEIYPLWIKQGPFDEAHEAYAAAILRSNLKGQDLGHALLRAGTLAGYAGDYAAAEGLLSKSREVYKSAGSRLGQAKALSNLAIHLMNADRVDDAINCSRGAVDLIEGEDDSQTQARILCNYVGDLRSAGRFEEAACAVAPADEALERVNDLWTRAALESNKAAIALGQSDTNEALRHLELSIDAYLKVGAAQGLLCCLEEAGLIAVRLGNYEVAAKLLGGVQHHFDVIGVGRPPRLESRRIEALGEAIDALGEPTAEIHVRAGVRHSLEELCALARSL